MSYIDDLIDFPELKYLQETLNNVKIGTNCKIGICTPVIENLKKNSVIFGNPGRVFFNNEK